MKLCRRSTASPPRRLQRTKDWLVGGWRRHRFVMSAISRKPGGACAVGLARPNNLRTGRPRPRGDRRYSQRRIVAASLSAGWRTTWRRKAASTSARQSIPNLPTSRFHRDRFRSALRLQVSAPGLPIILGPALRDALVVVRRDAHVHQIDPAAARRLGEPQGEDGVKVRFLPVGGAPRLDDHAAGDKQQIPALEPAVECREPGAGFCGPNLSSVG